MIPRRNSDTVQPSSQSESLISSERSSLVESTKAKLAGRTALIAMAGWGSNLLFGGAIGMNRLLEHNNIDTNGPAIGVAVASTAIEFATSYAGSNSLIDTDWNPKTTLGAKFKSVVAKAPFIVTSWRGAASGVALDQLSGKDITPKRRLAHAATYGFFMGVWASEGGSQIMERGYDAALDAVQLAAENPQYPIGAALATAAVAAYRPIRDRFFD